MKLYERKAAERLLQEGIEAALDINAHVIAEHGLEVPDDYYGGFLALAPLHILPNDLHDERISVCPMIAYGVRAVER